MPLSVCFPFHRGFNSERREFDPREQTLSIKRVNPFREWSNSKANRISLEKLFLLAKMMGKEEIPKYMCMYLNKLTDHQSDCP